jgi:hypothetical protein
MRLYAPSLISFLVALALTIIGVMKIFGFPVPIVTLHAMWCFLIASTLLLLGCIVRGI